MTRRRAAWLAARHIALWPWPAPGEPPLPTGHPWLAELAWLREAPSRRWLITFVWLAVAVATAGAGLAMATCTPERALILAAQLTDAAAAIQQHHTARTA